MTAPSSSSVPTLTPNPDGCARFEPNPFKKEKCKHCGKLWHEHLGVITEEQVQAFTANITKAAEAKAKADEAAKAKSRAKAAAKKKSAQAVEDEWFCDDGKNPANQGLEDDSDDEAGFQMFTPDTMDAALLGPSKGQQNSAEKRPAIIKNLIDFGECDLPEENGPPHIAEVVHRAPSPALDAGAAPSASRVPPGSDAGKSMPSSESLRRPSADLHQDLLAENDHLRLELTQERETKVIEVAMVREEVLEKQLKIEDLTQQLDEAQASIRQAQSELEALRSQQGSAQPSAPSASSDDSAAQLQKERDAGVHWRAEAERLREEAAAAEQRRLAELEQSRVEVEQSRAEVEQLRAQVAELVELKASAVQLPALRAEVTEALAKVSQQTRELEVVKAEAAASEAARRQADEEASRAREAAHGARQAQQAAEATAEERARSAHTEAEKARATEQQVGELQQQLQELNLRGIAFLEQGLGPRKKDAQEAIERGGVISGAPLSESHNVEAQEKAQLLQRNTAEIMRELRLRCEALLDWSLQKSRKGPALCDTPGLEGPLCR